VKAAHDCSDGGLAVALAEMCFPNGLGCKVAFKSALRPEALLFGEDASRILVSYPEGAREKVAAICKAAGAEFEEVGEVGGASLIIAAGEGLIDARVSELRQAWSSAIPKLVGEGIHQAALETVP
jgi:phosphoribosylformylglycinamidine synthase